jgi:uncharacterized protein YjbI with pentapeptide repeats
LSEERDHSGSFRISLQADCEACYGLCCVAPGFKASADFAIDKDPGQACPNLGSDFRCEIHTHLRQEGFPGCVVYDCYGAGQHVSQVAFGQRDWRQDPGTTKRMFKVFTILRQLHELLWYLAEALTLQPARALHDQLDLALARTEQIVRLDPEPLIKLDVAAHRQGIVALLLRASELVRAEAEHLKAERKEAHLIGADLCGVDLKGSDLRGVSLRGAYLLGADLRDADLRTADLLGADLRGADLSGADLTESIFLTQSQLNAANGDTKTKLPPSLAHPTHWSTSGSEDLG